MAENMTPVHASATAAAAAEAQEQQQQQQTKKEGSGETSSVAWHVKVLQNWYNKIDLGLRALAVGATLVAAVVMATNKQTRLLPLGPAVNNRPLFVPITAKFHYTPAYVFFVAVNAVAGGYALLSFLSFASVSLFSKSARSDFHKFITAFLDLAATAALAAGAAAATAISDLGRRGNSHAHWMKICDSYSKFCHHGGGALVSSFVAVAIFMQLNMLAIASIYRSASARARAHAPAAATSAV